MSVITEFSFYILPRFDLSVVAACQESNITYAQNMKTDQWWIRLCLKLSFKKINKSHLPLIAFGWLILQASFRSQFLLWVRETELFCPESQSCLAPGCILRNCMHAKLQEYPCFFVFILVFHSSCRKWFNPLLKQQKCKTVRSKVHQEQYGVSQKHFVYSLLMEVIFVIGFV